MITIRNPRACQSRTVVASAALSVGQVVKLIAGTASGEPPQVAPATAADVADATIEKGIVYFVADSDLTVDYILDPTDSSLTQNTESDNSNDIPAGAHCTFWYDKPVIGFTAGAVDAGYDISAAREGDKVAALGASSKLAAYDSGGINGSENYLGVVYQQEGAEITVMFTQF